MTRSGADSTSGGRGRGNLRSMFNRPHVFRSGLIDHRMARRSLINQYKSGRLGREEVCDMHPELLRAALSIGKHTETACPICIKEKLRLVTYVFGPRLPHHGRAVAGNDELLRFHRRAEEYTAYVVEACVGCRWNHLVRALPLGGQRSNRRVG